jgi:putative metallohydrolase (TIGR04338 family)
VRPRDSQRSKLYAAEHAIPGGKRYTTVAECQAFVDSVLDRKLVQRHYPSAMDERWYHDGRHYRIEVRDGRGHRNATGCAGTRIIQAPKWARSQRVLLHEMAHVLVGQGVAAHGWEFAGCYAFLVRQVMGKEAEAKLLASFKARKVRWRKPRAGRTLTPDQREAAVERLAVARAAKGNTDVSTEVD